MAYNNLGVELHAAGRSAEAALDFRKAIAIEPELAQAYNNLGVSLAEIGEIAEAKLSFSKALSLEPGVKGARENLARAMKIEMPGEKE